MQAHDSQQDLYYADLFPKKLCPTTLFNNPTRANWQKATDISAETDHLVFKQWNYRVQAFIYLLLERALINYRDLPPSTTCVSVTVIDRLFHQRHLYSLVCWGLFLARHARVTELRSYILHLSHQSEKEKRFQSEVKTLTFFSFLL